MMDNQPPNPPNPQNVQNPPNPPNEDDDYEHKLAEMQKYIPVLENLIEKYKGQPANKIYKLENLYETLKSSTNKLV